MNRNIHEAEAAALLAKLISETDPRRRRELTLKLELAKKLAERAASERPVKHE